MEKPEEQNEQKPQTSSETDQAGNGAEDPATPQEAKPTAEELLQKELLYLRADFENTKRRLLREQETAIRFANEKFMGELLSVVDLLERAISSSKPVLEKIENNPLGNEVRNFVTGVEMTHRELLNVLGRFGVELTGSAGELFDPARHEALSERETDETNAGKVLEVVQKGSLLHGRLLKPARVVVGKIKS